MPAEVRSPTPGEVALIQRVESERWAAEQGLYSVMEGVWVLAIAGYTATGDPRFLFFPWQETNDTFVGTYRSEIDTWTCANAAHLLTLSNRLMCCVSGGVDSGNSPLQQAAQELWEEQGVEVPLEDFVQHPLPSTDLSKHDLPTDSVGTYTVQRTDEEFDQGRKRVLVLGKHVYSFYAGQTLVDDLKRRYRSHGLHSAWTEPMTAREALEGYHKISSWALDRHYTPTFWRLIETLYESRKLDWLPKRLLSGMPSRKRQPLRPSTVSLLQLLTGEHPTLRQEK